MTQEQRDDQAVDEEYMRALRALLLQAADDELVMGHRESEWLGMAPEIEEDVAFGSISQDEVGHAAFYYQLLASLTGETVETLAYERNAKERRNAALLERDNGDWAFTMVRHYFYDEFDHLRLTALAHSSYEPLRQGAAKMLREEYYHRLHAATWFSRLARAGGEAKERMERAIDLQWKDMPDLFAYGESEPELLANGIITMTSTEVTAAWLETVSNTMREAGLSVPAWPSAVNTGASRGVHTAELPELLGTLAQVYNLDKSAVW